VKTQRDPGAKAAEEVTGESRLEQMIEEALDPAEGEERGVAIRLVSEHELPAVSGDPKDPVGRVVGLFLLHADCTGGIGSGLNVVDHGLRKVKAAETVKLSPQAQFHVLEVEMIALIE
jgi:hypothetical protein